MNDQQVFFSFFPQFHADPINDKAWGMGFTDWDLIKALPENRRDQFSPAAGYYDPSDSGYLTKICKQLSNLPLRDPGLMVYHYYFDGVHALSGFEQQLLAQPKKSIPFFLCWANETWTKRWVGKSREIIVEQKHLLNDRLIKSHAQYLSKFFLLPHYHRVEGRPLLIIYDAQASVNLSTAVDLYRKEFSLLGQDPLIGICISYPVPLEQILPYDFGCEFEPRFFFNSFGAPLLSRNAARIKVHFPKMFEWLGAQRDKVRRGSAGQQFEFSKYLEGVENGRLEALLRGSIGEKPLMRSTFLTWDNLPRYRTRSTRVGHEKVSDLAINHLGELRSDKGFPLLVNSWNEWSEGAALEEGVKANKLRLSFLDALNSSRVK